METEVANLFAEQVSLGMLVQNLVYASGTVGAIFVVIGLMLIDVGGVRRRNIFNVTIEKMVGFFTKIQILMTSVEPTSIQDSCIGIHNG